MDGSWLPKHTFVILFQIQGHTANALEDLDSDELLDDTELESIDNFLDSIIDTYEEMRTLIDEGMENYRRRNMSVVKSDKRTEPDSNNQINIQVSLSGTDVWRRFMTSGECTLEEIHNIIQLLFGWTGKYPHRFVIESRSRKFKQGEALDNTLNLYELHSQGIIELLYEYWTQWMVRLLLLSVHNVSHNAVQDAVQHAMQNEVSQSDNTQSDDKELHARCIAASGAAPPEALGGPLRFRRFISILRNEEGPEQTLAKKELGPDFNPDFFDMDACNKMLKAICEKKSAEQDGM